MTATKTKALLARATVLGALVVAPVLSSCGVNFGAQTDQVYVPTEGTNARDGGVYVLHALIISETPGSGRLVAGLASKDSEEADTLTGVTAEADEEGAAPPTLEITGGETEIPAGGLLQLAEDGAAFITVTGDPEQVRPGTFVRVTFTFENAEEATVNVPVVEPGTDYDDIPLTPSGESPAGNG